jgi:hypothetical protein
MTERIKPATPYRRGAQLSQQSFGSRFRITIVVVTVFLFAELSGPFLALIVLLLIVPRSNL